MGNMLVQQENLTARRLLKCRSLLRKMVDKDSRERSLYTGEGQLSGELRAKRIGEDLKVRDGLPACLHSFLSIYLSVCLPTLATTALIATAAAAAALRP